MNLKTRIFAGGSADVALRIIGVGLLVLGALVSRADEFTQQSRVPTPVDQPNSPPNRAPEDPEGLNLSLNVEHRLPFNGDYNFVTQANLVLENGDECNHGGLIFGAGIVDLKSGSFANTITHRPFIGEFGLTGRHYFLPTHVFVQPYVTGTISSLLMGWEYRGSQDTDGGSIERDWVYGVNGYLGSGVAFSLHKRWKLFGEIGVGGIALPAETVGGVKNEMFDSFGYVGVKAGLAMPF